MTKPIELEGNELNKLIKIIAEEIKEAAISFGEGSARSSSMKRLKRSISRYEYFCSFMPKGEPPNDKAA